MVENSPTIPENDQEPLPQPKARGRPKGTKDTKPRIKRVPIEVPPQDKPEVKTKKPEAKPKKELVRYEEEEEEEEEAEDSPISAPRQVEEDLPPPKSPRTLHRERVQQAATERRQLARDRQDRFERILDNFMGF